MRIVVTGGSGFVGGFVIGRLVADGHDVFCVGRSPERCAVGTPVEWDFSASGSAQLPSKFDAIIHLAQARNYRRFPEHAPEMFQVNVASTATLLDAAVRAGASRFVLISSGTVYEPFSGDLVEDANLCPTSSLGATKLAAEILARPYSKLLALSIIRVFAPYGPGQQDRLVPDLIRRIRTQEAVTIGPNGGLTFSPTYVMDLLDVIVAAVMEGWSGTYNVAAPYPVTIKAVAEIIGQLLSIVPKFETVAMSEIRVVPNLEKLASRYDMNRFVSIHQGLSRTLGKQAPI